MAGTSEETRMGTHIAALKAAIGEVSVRAARLESAGLIERAAEAYVTLLQVLNALFSPAEEQGYGWGRVVPALTDLNRRLALDALAPQLLGQLQTRAAALFDLPDITQIASLAEVHQAIVSAISVGAPRYNSGDIRGCCTMYWATGQALLCAQAVRGFPGYARVLAPIRQVYETEVPTHPLDRPAADAYAWALRHAFDAALQVSG
jgi:hypothetical protein